MSYAATWPQLPPTLTAGHVIQRWRASGRTPGDIREAAPLPDPWIDSIVERLGELGGLEANWDEEGANSVDPTLLKAVMKFVTSDTIRRLSSPPDIVPTVSGGLMIEWHTLNADLIIEAVPNGSPSVYFHNVDTGFEVERPVDDPEALTAVATAFANL